jgi:hypothetical protein
MLPQRVPHFDEVAELKELNGVKEIEEAPTSRNSCKTGLAT